MSTTYRCLYTQLNIPHFWIHSIEILHNNPKSYYLPSTAKNYRITSKISSIKLHITWLFSDMNIDDITVLDPVYSTWNGRKNFSCQDCPTPVLEIQYEGLSNTLPHKNPVIITLTKQNKTAFTLPSYNYAIINFSCIINYFFTSCKYTLWQWFSI